MSLRRGSCRVGRRLSAGLLGLVLSAAVVGCGGGDDPAPADKASAAVVEAGFNDADVLFAQSMIPHHEQAIEIAELALDPAGGASPAVRDLAGRVKSGQDPEIATLTAWLKARGKSTTMDMAGHDMSTMDGMLSAADMKALDAASGPAFDRLFYEQMIRHHQGAVAMARIVKEDGADPEIAALADAVIAAQSDELAEMTKAIGA